MMKKTNKILVSLITVSYNSEKTISRTIESVLNQTYDNIEYIIIDGCSIDNTMDIAKKYINEFKNSGFTYLIKSEPDDGIYEAMNKGISMASGQLIGIINSDDWYEKDSIENIVKTFINNPYDIVYGNLNVIRKGNNIIKKAKLSKILTTRSWNHPSMFVNKKTYLDIGTYKSNNIYADWDFLLRSKKNGKKIIVIDKVLANFSTTGISHRKSFKDFKMRFRDRYKCYIENDYSRFYIIECLGMELIKLLV